MSALKFTSGPKLRGRVPWWQDWLDWLTAAGLDVDRIPLGATVEVVGRGGKIVTEYISRRDGKPYVNHDPAGCDCGQPVPMGTEPRGHCDIATEPVTVSLKVPSEPSAPWWSAS